MNLLKQYLTFMKNRHPVISLMILDRMNKRRGGKDIELMLDMAQIYMKKGQAAAAENEFREILAVNSREARAYYGLGVLYDNRKEYKDAITFYKKAIELNPKYTSAHYFLAYIYDETGEKEKAIQSYKKVISLEPRNFWAHNNLGAIYEELNQNDTALDYFKKSHEIDPNHYKALFNLGVILYKIGYTERAINNYMQSLEKNNRYPFTYLNLAVIYKDQGDYLKAIDIITRGIKQTKDAFLYYNRACFYIHENRLDEALTDVEKAVNSSPALLDYMKKDEELEPLRKLPKYSAKWGESKEGNLN